ncbi:MAG: S26 family signal peptidase [Euryarchaeota archaeon]|nr:S26 family signal peptidase [Euryarchaeota archaeon]
MDGISAVQKSITVVLVAIAVALVVGQLLGQPLLIGYVATGSMDPTLAVGDGFVAIPPVLAGGIGPGDVITYEAQAIDGGGPTTHRVVGTTAEGYITQGDANSFTDQDAGEPPVTETQVLAVVLQVDGEVVKIPSIGTGATAVQNVVGSITGAIGVGGAGRIGVMTSGFGIVLIAATLLYGFLTSENHRETSRSTSRSDMVSSRVVLGGLILLLMVPLLTSMVLPSDTTTNRLFSAEASIAGDGGRVTAGGSTVFPFALENNQYVPKVVIVEPASSGIEVLNSTLAIQHGESEAVRLRVTAPAETGAFARSYSEHHYLHVLPIPVIKLLHAINPFVAKLLLSVVPTLPIVGLYVFFVGVRPISLRQAHR